MRDLKKSKPPGDWAAVFLAVAVMSGQQAALAQATEPAPVVPTAAAEAAVEAAALRPVDIHEYIVRGNTVLDARSIERAVTPFLGPRRTMKDIEGARDALLAVY